MICYLYGDSVNKESLKEHLPCKLGPINHPNINAGRLRFY
jgi:hypothetical protein